MYIHYVTYTCIYMYMDITCSVGRHVLNGAATLVSCVHTHHTLLIDLMKFEHYLVISDGHETNLWSLCGHEVPMVKPRSNPYQDSTAAEEFHVVICGQTVYICWRCPVLSLPLRGKPSSHHYSLCTQVRVCSSQTDSEMGSEVLHLISESVMCCCVRCVGKNAVELHTELCTGFVGNPLIVVG